MNIINKKLIVTLVAPFTLATSLIITPNIASAGYLVDKQGHLVLNKYKECWQGRWTGPGLQETCGDSMPQPDEPMMKEVYTPPMAAVYGDADNDGVKDNLDRCPNSQTTQVDANGCALDSDRDSVADYIDNCPSTALGLKVDANGCHIIQNLTIRLDVEGFDVDSARLRPAMMSALDSVAEQVLSSAGDETLSIMGHTDSMGSDSYNQSLSERRAASVLNYLANKGINRGSMSSSGMGESSPIGDNSTSSGRAENRRVEILTR